MVNILNTTIGAPFRSFVKERVESRNEALVSDNYIDLDPDVYEAFVASTAVSRKCHCFLSDSSIFSSLCRAQGHWQESLQDWCQTKTDQG